MSANSGIGSAIDQSVVNNQRTYDNRDYSDNSTKINVDSRNMSDNRNLSVSDSNNSADSHDFVGNTYGLQGDDLKTTLGFLSAQLNQSSTAINSAAQSAIGTANNSLSSFQQGVLNNELQRQRIENSMGIVNQLSNNPFILYGLLAVGGFVLFQIIKN